LTPHRGSGSEGVTSFINVTFVSLTTVASALYQASAMVATQRIVVRSVSEDGPVFGPREGRGENFYPD